jgi:hypothetical protein
VGGLLLGLAFVESRAKLELTVYRRVSCISLYLGFKMQSGIVYMVLLGARHGVLVSVCAVLRTGRNTGNMGVT